MRGREILSLFVCLCCIFKMQGQVGSVQVYDIIENNIRYHLEDSDNGYGDRDYYDLAWLTGVTEDFVAPDTLTIPKVIHYAYNDFPVVSVTKEAFQGCESLKVVIFSNADLGFGDRAFANCTNLTSVDLSRILSHYPYSYGYFGTAVFSGCRSLKSVKLAGELPEYTGLDILSSISDSMFEDCVSLDSIHLAPHYMGIGNRAFAGCTSLSKIHIPATVRYIGKQAFANCTSLEEIYIPASVETIGIGVFEGCLSLKEITIDPENPYIVLKDGLLLSHDEKTLLFSLKPLEGEFSIPDYITTVNEDAFDNSPQLTDIFIPASVKTLPPSAFKKCRSLQAIEVDEVNKLFASVDGILYEKYSFQANDGVHGRPQTHNAMQLLLCPQARTSIALPESAMKISSSALDACTSLSTIILPEKLKQIGAEAFYGCVNLSEIVYQVQNPLMISQPIFKYNTLQTATLYISPDAPEALPIPWCNFKNIVRGEYASAPMLPSDWREEVPAEVYNLNGIKVGDSTENLPSGIYIVIRGTNTSKLIVR